MVVQIHYDPLTIVKSRSRDQVTCFHVIINLMTNAKATVHEIGLHSHSI
jgi:hypothetical protein